MTGYSDVHLINKSAADKLSDRRAMDDVFYYGS